MRNLDLLTEQENTVAQLVTQGLNNAAIADKLSIVPRTVEHHVSSIIAKYQISRDSHARVNLVLQFLRQMGNASFVEELERLTKASLTRKGNTPHVCHVFTSHLACEICHNIFTLAAIIELASSPEVQLPPSAVRSFIENIKEKHPGQEVIVNDLRDTEEALPLHSLTLKNMSTPYEPTKRELDVAKLKSQGFHSNEIANKLGISPSYIGRIIFLLAGKVDPASPLSPSKVVINWYRNNYPESIINAS